MRALTWLSTALLPSLALGLASKTLAAGSPAPQQQELRALAGEWLYVEDRTKDRPVEQRQPPMSIKFALRVEPAAVVQVRGQGARKREQRFALDGSVTEVPGTDTITRYRGSSADGEFRYETEVLRAKDKTRVTLIKRSFRPVPEGLLVRVIVGSPPRMDSLALYRHPADIALPAPAKARIADLAWLGGAWTGARGKSTIEERWSPAGGGAMLGTSRTVSRGRMTAFEFLRIVERDGGLVYIAQPNGKAPTGFVLTSTGPRRAVFDNPRHDFPQRIVYELSTEGELRAAIGFINGGRPRSFAFRREER